MSRFDKLRTKLQDPQRDASWEFSEICDLLTRLGFEMRVSGSHHFFRMAGIAEAINLQPENHHAKPYQIRQARKLLVQFQLL